MLGLPTTANFRRHTRTSALRINPWAPRERWVIFWNSWWNRKAIGTFQSIFSGTVRSRRRCNSIWEKAGLVWGVLCLIRMYWLGIRALIKNVASRGGGEVF